MVQHAALSVSEERASLTRSAALASISVALFLGVLKTWAVWQTGSTAMLGSLADTALDLVASCATLIAVWVAARPADDDHRFGHGKAEALAAMFQVILIALSASAIAFRAVLALVDGQETRAAEAGIGVSIVAIVATMGLVAWQKHVVRKTNSVAIQTDSIHYQSDILLNLAVIAALVLDQLAGFAAADPLLGLAIAAWLMWNAWSAAGDAIDHLMDREWPEDKRRAFVEAAARHHELANLHDLRTRTSGTADFAQFHVDMPGGMTVAEAHDVIDRVETDLVAQFPGLELLIHIDPAGHVDEPDNPLTETDEFALLEDNTP